MSAQNFRSNKTGTLFGAPLSLLASGAEATPDAAWISGHLCKCRYTWQRDRSKRSTRGST